jgi:4-hydroxyphenylpyruvate dioxygenase-like putative hemolysin
MQFMSIPDTYYTNLKEKLKGAKITVKEDIDVVWVLLTLSIKSVP